MLEAVLVQQLHFWTAHATQVHDGHRWVYKTYEEWSDETGASAQAVRRAFSKLREDGRDEEKDGEDEQRRGVVVVIASPKDAHDRTLWWRIDYAKLGLQVRQLEVSDSADGRVGNDSSRARVPSPPSEAQGEEETETTDREPPRRPPQGGRSRDHQDWEQDLEAWSAEHFPGVTTGYVRNAVEVVRRARPHDELDMDLVRQEVERWAP